MKLGAELGKVDDIDMVWVGPSVDAMMDVLPQLRPRVLVLQYEHLGGTPVTRAQLLSMLSGAELTIVTYKFARDQVLKALNDASVRTLREPLTADELRAQISDAIARLAEAEVIRPNRFAVTPLLEAETA
ncbi:MAG: hypothetical protein KDK70_02915 [Myxococcales bacterium]|nr:hypothetical protein [Myxococcales bacterium]